MRKFSWKLRSCEIAMYLVLVLASAVASKVNETCLGTDELTSYHPNLGLRYNGCKFVIGNLVIKQHKFDTISLENIEEVTGYVHIINYYNTSRHLVLPKLKIIRGEILFRTNPGDADYALILDARAEGSSFQVEFPELREISNGSVGIYADVRQCFLETINWEEIMNGANSKFDYYPYYDKDNRLYLMPPPNVSNEDCQNKKCHPNCGTGGCWGERLEQCQKFSKLDCSAQCGGERCFGPSSQECCHFACVGGCTGPKRSDCISCRNVRFDGECKESCPAGKYSFGVNCIDSCPSDSLVDEENKDCLFECPDNKVDKSGKCVRLLPTEKKCRLVSHYPTNIHSGSIEHFRNCTVYEGSIRISGDLNSQFYNKTHKHTPSAVLESQWELFKSLTKITGELDIYNLNLARFPYFENLEEIGEGLWIHQTGLESLDFPVLRRIDGIISFHSNHELCYVYTFNWTAITTTIPIFTDYKNFKHCKRDDKVCSEQCSKGGCLGPTPEQCLCLNYRQEEKCVSACDVEHGYLKVGYRCVKNCASGKYLPNGECVECHKNCKAGCTGPENIFGSGGCVICYQALISGNNITCMEKGEICPLGYVHVLPEEHSEYLGVAENFLCVEPKLSITELTQFLTVFVIGFFLVAMFLVVGLYCYCKRRSTQFPQIIGASFTPHGSLTEDGDHIQIIQQSP